MARNANKGSFGVNGRKGGRKPGVPNRTTSQLKDAILKAGELSGHDQNGKDGLVGYLKRVADQDMKAFSGLLGKVLPIQVQGDPDQPLVPNAVQIVFSQQPNSDNRT